MLPILPYFPLLHFPPLRPAPDFSTPAFSVAPFDDPYSAYSAGRWSQCPVVQYTSIFTWHFHRKDAISSEVVMITPHRCSYHRRWSITSPTSLHWQKPAAKAHIFLSWDAVDARWCRSDSTCRTALHGIVNEMKLKKKQFKTVFKQFRNCFVPVWFR